MGSGSSTNILPQPSNRPDQQEKEPDGGSEANQDKRNKLNSKKIVVRPARPVKKPEEPEEPAGGNDYHIQPPQDDSDLPKPKVS